MANFLSSVKNIFKKGGKSVLGIDIGASAVKLVQLRNDKGAVVLETYGSLAVGPYVNKDVGNSASLEASVIVEVLKTLLKEAEVSSNVAGFAVPFRSSFTSLITLPSLPDSKLAEAIPYEARKYIPTSLDEVSIDWFIIPDALLKKDDSPIQEGEPEEPKRKVLLTAIHNHDLEAYKKIADTTAVEIKFFEIEIFSTLRSITNQDRTPVMFIDIGARTTKFYLVERGIILRSYFINQGGQSVTESLKTVLGISFKEAESLKREKGLNIEDITAKEAISSVLTEIFSEANHAITDFQERYKKDVNKIIFTGGGATISGLLTEASQKLSPEVEIANPFSNVRHPVFLKETLNEVGPEFAVAIGCALRALQE